MKRLTEEKITALHGAGGAVMEKLILEHILPKFSLRRAGPIGLDELDDGAVVDLPPGKLVITTDSHAVKPLFFPGGDIGKLAVTGTVNDLCVMGARPVALTLALIVEEGFSIADLERILESAAAVLSELGLPLVTGDTKVMGKSFGHEDFCAKAARRFFLAHLPFHPELPFCIVLYEFLAEVKPGVRDFPDSAPDRRPHPENLAEKLFGPEVSFFGYRPRIRVFHLRPSLPKLPEDQRNGVEDIEGLEAGHHNGHLEFFGNFPVRAGADHRGDVPGRQKSIDGNRRGGKKGRKSRRDEFVAHEDKEILRRPLGEDRGGSRRSGLKAHSKEDHRLFGVTEGDLHRIRGGKDYPHIRPFRPGLFKGHPASRNPGHVPKRAEDRPFFRNPKRAIEILGGGDTHRAAWPLQNLHALRKEAS